MTLLCSTRNFSWKLIYNPKLPNKSINLMTTRNSIELINLNAIWIYFVLQKKLNFAPKSHGKCEYLESWRVKRNSRKLTNFFRNAIINYIASHVWQREFHFYVFTDFSFKMNGHENSRAGAVVVESSTFMSFRCWPIANALQCLYIYLRAFRMRVSSCE